MNISKLQTTVIIKCILGLVILGLGIGIIAQRLAISGLRSEVAEKTKELAKLRTEDTDAKSMTVKYKDLVNKLGDRYQKVSWGKHLPTMMNQINGIMTAHSIKMDTLRPEPLTNANDISRLPMHISFKANLGDLARVVQDIEKATPLLSIEQLDVRVPTNQSDLLEMDMIVSSFAITDSSVKEEPKI